jgi:hypothetical protein
MPNAWQREHSVAKVASPASISVFEAFCSGGFSKGSSTRAGGGGTAPPPSFRAMTRLVFSYLFMALFGGAGPSAMPVPP